MVLAQKEENISIVRRWVREVFNEHRLDSVEQLKVPDYVDWNPYPGQDIALSGFKAVLATYLESFPDFRYDVDEELGEGDIVVCIGKWSGTHQHDYMGIPASGKKISARRIDIVRLAGDKMTERWGTGNELKMLRLLGVAKRTPSTVEGTGAAAALRRFVAEVLQEHDLAAIDELVDVDARGRGEGSLVLFALTAALDDLRFDVRDVTEQDGTARAELTITGRHARQFWDVPGDGREISLRATISVQADGERMTRVDLDVPLDEVAEALGVDPARLAAAPRPVAPTGTAGDGRFVLRSLVNDVLNGKRLNVIRTLMGPGATDSLQESLTTAALLHAFPDGQFNIERVIVDGDRVTVLAAFAGTHTRDLLGMAPTGKGVITRCISLFTVRDGVISDAIYNFDLHTLLSQLEAFPAVGTYAEEPTTT